MSKRQETKEKPIVRPKMASYLDEETGKIQRAYIYNLVHEDLTLFCDYLQQIITVCGSESLEGRYVSVQMTNRIVDSVKKCFTYTAKICEQIKDGTIRRDPNWDKLLIDGLVNIYHKLENLQRVTEKEYAKSMNDEILGECCDSAQSLKEGVEQILEAYFQVVPYRESNRNKYNPNTQIRLTFVENADKKSTYQRTIHSGFYDKFNKQLVAKEIVFSTAKTKPSPKAELGNK